ncbi:intracellular family 1 beta glucosidase Bgl1a [Paraphysoderma sedebokerense]|nr:intracellular family 1 beta glucosidase Bgl1a [Paraphysoderma sedebokerense]
MGAEVQQAGGIPKGFTWGLATASYQVEGGYNADGRGMSIWDTFSRIPGKVRNNDNGDVSADHYNRYPEDIELLSNLNATAYRFSISWSRILPSGTGQVNQKGIDFYNKLINGLISKGIEPVATMYHWDLPQALQDRYRGPVGRQFVADFVNYADVVFKAFGDRVKRWITFNEPLSFCVLGYGNGVHAPGSKSLTDPFLCSHHVNLAHAETTKLFRQKYKRDGSQIGITLNVDWVEPYSNDPKDVEASARCVDYQLGWYADPIFFGDYPLSMRKNLPSTVLPAFTEQEKELLRSVGKPDFFGLNHYTSRWGKASGKPLPQTYTSFYDVSGTIPMTNKDGKEIGPVADSSWLYVVPWGFRKILTYVHNKYKTPILVTENGVSVPNESAIPLTDALNDTFRVNYYEGYLNAMKQAIVEDGADVRGYFAWSLLDNFEWADGYSVRFGVVYTDYKTFKRYPKASAKMLARKWFPQR